MSQQTQVKEQTNLSNQDIEQQENTNEIGKVGFTKYAERLNGRLAMIGFVFLLAIAILTKHGIIGLIGN